MNTATPGAYANRKHLIWFPLSVIGPKWDGQLFKILESELAGGGRMIHVSAGQASDENRNENENQRSRWTDNNNRAQSIVVICTCQHKWQLFHLDTSNGKCQNQS